jgi:hypothetical protein
MKKKTLTLTLLFILALSSLAEDKSHSQNFRFDFLGGEAYSTAKGTETNNTDPNSQRFIDFTNKLRWMKNLQASLHYHISSYSYLGMKYHFFYSSASMSDYQFYSTDNYGNTIISIGNVKEKRYVNYIGPSYLYEKSLDQQKKWLFSSSVTIGYTSYREEDSVILNRLLATSNSFGVGYDLGVNYCLNKSIFIGVKTGLFTSRFSKIKTSNGSTTQTTKLDSKDAINLTNVNLSIGLSYHF